VWAQTQEDALRFASLGANVQGVFGNLKFDAQVGKQIDELLRLFLRYHFEGLKPLKSTELFHQYMKAAK